MLTAVCTLFSIVGSEFSTPCLEDFGVIWYFLVEVAFKRLVRLRIEGSPLYKKRA